jgi:hypothetical protein
VKGDQLAAWVTDHLNNPARDGEQGDLDTALQSVYGFDPEVFEETVDACAAGLDLDDDDDDRMVFAMLMFELGHAWRDKRADEARKLQIFLGL